MIWTGESETRENHFRAFRRVFVLSDRPRSAVLHIFADSRYLLWVNGEYVTRGPARFDPGDPAYDAIDVASRLRSGANVIAVQVMAFRSGTSGQRIRHVPGLAAELIAGGSRILATEPSWLWSDRTQFSVTEAGWGFVRFDNDGRNEPSGWETAEFDDSDWRPAVRVDGGRWGPLRASPLPRLPEIEAAVDPPPIRPSGLTYPISLAEGESVTVDLGRMVLGFEVVDLEAAAGAVLRIEHGQRFDARMTDTYGSVNSYTARNGRQVFMAADSYGHRYLELSAAFGAVVLHGLTVVERRYPYLDAGSFRSNDAFLNDVWDRAVQTLRVNCEDGYLDCPLRERSEWMGDAAVVEYPCTRVAFGIADPEDGIVRSDAGLMTQMIRHIALSRTSDGRLKAHAPSDRWDIHGFIEDYACLWVRALRDVYDHTGDGSLVREVWPALTGQMRWFLDRRTLRGLVNAREFTFADNPQAYNVCEGATLNAFVYKALRDAAYLAGEIGRTRERDQYDAAAAALFEAFNRELWCEDAGAYLAGLDSPDDVPAAAPSRLEPSTHSALIPLHAGIVPPERVGRVREHLFSTWSTTLRYPYTHAWLFEEFAGADEPRLDVEALDSIRDKWAEVMRRTDTGTLTESYDGGEAAHNFGASPVHYLAAHVLGVRLDGPAREKRILIEPRLGDLTSAEGTVVTEHGPVPVSWRLVGTNWDFAFTVPAGVTARLRLPVGPDSGGAVLDGRPLEPGTRGVVLQGRWLECAVGPGRHGGWWSMIGWLHRYSSAGGRT